jgi:Glycosyl transferase family 2
MSGTLDRIAHGWRCLNNYIESLVRMRVEFEGEAEPNGALAQFHKALFAVRFYLRNRAQRALNVRRLAASRARASIGGCAQPLVSVVIPTHNRRSLLMERAIPSALNQTYPNIEVIVVGDRCLDGTGHAVRSLVAPNVNFFELPHGAGRPEDAYDAWLAAGIEASNLGLRMSSGEWVVHLDDDDELEREHVEVLLRFARENDYEFVYPKVRVVDPRGESHELGTYPPELGGMTHSGVLYSSVLKVFTYDRKGWRYLEPCDWNLWRRMKEAGVRIGFLDRTLGTIYPAGAAAYCTSADRSASVEASRVRS